MADIGLIHQHPMIAVRAAETKIEDTGQGCFRVAGIRALMKMAVPDGKSAPSCWP